MNVSNLNVGRFLLLELEVPILVSRNAVPQSAGQGQAAILTIIMMLVRYVGDIKDENV